MKKAFTLLELLVVVVIMCSLMTMVYRLTGISGGASSIAGTVSKMQRLENALSGYMAAFGSYPPVKVQGYQDIYRNCTQGEVYYSEPDKAFNRNWVGYPWQQIILQVTMACKSQPIMMDFPYEPDQSDHVIETSNMIIEKMNKGVYDADMAQAKEDLGDLFETYKQSALAGFDIGSPFSRFNVQTMGPDGQMHNLTEATDWNQLKLFRFGLLSFLLPRYLIMMGCAAGSTDKDNPMSFAQWTANNALPARYWLDGTPYKSWEEFLDDLGGEDGKDKTKRWRIEMIPSQSVCQRWLQNLSGDMITGRLRTLYGVEIGNGMSSLLIERWMDVYDQVFSPGQNGTGVIGDQYVLDNYDILDGFGKSFYYYSPPPYTSYRLWSGGAGGVAAQDPKSEGATFPPWMTLEDLQDEDIPAEEQRKVASAWMSDDIVHLSH